MSKICNKCSIERPLENYGKDKRNKDGLQGVCEPCRKLAKQQSRRNRMKSGPEILISDKTCNSCNQSKPVSEFYRDSGIADGYRTDCKLCRDASTYKWRAENRTRYNENQRKQHAKNYQRNRLYRYNLTPEQHSAMLKEQNGLCKICKKPPQGIRPLAVDHDRLTGEVRGLLCYGCNRAISSVDNNPLHSEYLNYLKKKQGA